MAMGQTTITPEPESRFWIEGASNVNRFSCTAERFEGEMVIDPALPEEFSDEIGGEISLELRIPVLSFECGRRRMNRDIYEALKSDSHPYIHFEYLDTRVLEQLEEPLPDRTDADWERDSAPSDEMHSEMDTEAGSGELERAEPGGGSGEESSGARESERQSSDDGEGLYWLLEVEGILTVAGTSRSITFNAEGAVLDEKRVRVRGHKPILMTDYDIDPPTALLGVVRAQNELTVHFDIEATID